MSNYDFLVNVVGYDAKVCYISEPITYDDGSFSVEVSDNEGWSSIIILFDKDGNYRDIAY